MSEKDEKLAEKAAQSAKEFCEPRTIRFRPEGQGDDESFVKATYTMNDGEFTRTSEWIEIKPPWWATRIKELQSENQLLKRKLDYCRG